MALNSPLHDLYLSMPIEAVLMPELRGLPFWGRTVHETLEAVNPMYMLWLVQNQRLQVFIELKQGFLQKEARKLEKEWRRRHPLIIDSGYLARACWLRHGKLAVREFLIDELTKNLVSDCKAE